VRKLQSLDGLRAIAIIGVFLTHECIHLPVTGIGTFLLRIYLLLGWMGVDLFFVISGFLITGILLDTKIAENYFTGFYARRVLRIFPLYYVSLVGVLWLAKLLAPSEFSTNIPLHQDQWLYFSFLSNWLGLSSESFRPTCLSPFWSLAIEEQFYLLWPLTLWLLPRRAVLWVSGTLVMVSALVRLVWLSHGGIQLAISFATITRMDGLFIGAICAYLFREPETLRKMVKWFPWIAAVCFGSFFVAFTVVVFSDNLFHYVPTGVIDITDASMWVAQYGGYTAIAMGAGALVLFAAATENRISWLQSFLQSRALRSIGKYSYGIYVLHSPIAALAGSFVVPIINRNPGSPMLLGLAYVTILAVVTYLVAAFSYELFEKKILSFKRFFEPRFPQHE
jgi:peptidoglycan/LPS O-acetylase OafA/YrhL